MLLVNEIFYSIQGETTTSGFPSLFIRLSGCNLNCSYCDSRYANADGKNIDIDSLLQIIASTSFHHITITGGEPLFQQEVIAFMQQLSDLDYNVQLETNGSISLKDVPLKIRKIIDVKPPSSGECESFHMENLDYISNVDEFKFVVANQADFIFAMQFITGYIEPLGKDVVVNISPVFGKMESSELADLILNSQLQVRLNIQLHKTVWPNMQKEGIQFSIDDK